MNVYFLYYYLLLIIIKIVLVNSDVNYLNCSYIFYGHQWSKNSNAISNDSSSNNSYQMKYFNYSIFTFLILDYDKKIVDLFCNAGLLF